jgi:hypothetical protein
VVFESTVAPAFRERLIATVDRADPGHSEYGVDTDAIVDAVLAELGPIRELLFDQAVAASAATAGTWNDSPTDVLEAQGLPDDVIQWVLLVPATRAAAATAAAAAPASGDGAGSDV